MATIPNETPGLLPDLPETLNFSKMEEAVLAYWKEIDAFQTSLKKSEGRPAWSFYDGPPFATGMPHYGHILAGTIKDVVCRYAHQTGHHVERRFGWDCHGLPIEFEIEKELGIKSSHDVQKMGIAAYNQACRGIVMRYANEWERIITRSGRWIDFKNDYKTLNLSYMESVWWVFKQLWEKKLVYRGFKVMPYSTGCTTPLSNFEANMNYKDVPDPSVMVTFPIVGDADNAAMLAWTTTPWTLPSNLGLTVNAGFDYLRVRDTKTNNVLIFAECRLDEVYKNHAKAEVKPFTVLSKCKGSDLVGLKYVPLFPYFQEKMGETAFRVVADNYVSADSGTGVVHSAPGFGEDDYRVCVANGIITKDGGIVCPVDENGCYTAEVTDFAGKHVKESDAAVMDMIKANGRLFSKGTIIHSYPYCWRSETPLIYKAVESWFVNVEGMRDRLLKNVHETTWVPEFVQTRRFQNWLEDARDWNVSRNRYFGTPLPVWHSADWEEIICVGSVAELEQLSGVSGINDLHRETVDNITIPSKRPGMPPLKRIAPVFDCWFESGSMPYAQSHYPFAFPDPKAFETRFPADFIAEGLDQTRGWFYTMLVLGTALFDKAPFKNVIVNGLVLAADGSKMSKSKKNYPPVEDILNTCGADALRLFLINSPVVRAEPLRFREEGVKEVVRDVFLPLVNAFKFFVQNANARMRRGKHDLSLAAPPSTNVMDIWIVAATQTLVGYFHDEMKGYRLYTVLPGVMRFLEVLTNWYVRMNRRRLKGYGSSAEEEADQVASLNTLLYVLFAAVRVLAPLTPFLAETLYQLIKPVLPADQQEDSIHYLMLPAKDASRIDANVERSMNRLMTIIELVRVMRDRKNYPMKKPIKNVVVIHSNPEYIKDVSGLNQYFEGEINALNVTYTSDEGDYVVRKVEANMAALGKRLKKEAGAISAALKKFTPQETAAFLASGTAVVMGQTITMEDVKVTHTFREGIENYATNTDNDVLVLMTTEMDEAMVDMWRAREFVSAVQKLRKKAGLVITDKVQVQLTTEHDEVIQSLTNAAATISATVPEGSWSVSKAGAAAAAAAAAEPLIESDADAEVGALSVKIQLFRA